MIIERFKSHRELYERCLQLVNSKQLVCQTIIDYTDGDLKYLTNFNLTKDYIFKEDNELNENVGMWKVGRLCYKSMN